MDWARDLPGWSHPDLSRQIACPPHRWHVQLAGSGPQILLLPGAGASTHSWRALIPPLAARHQVIALDLPGLGFTQTPPGRKVGLAAMAADIEALLVAQGWAPEVILAHSAGVAIALRLAQKRPVRQIIGINPALEDFQGLAGWIFPFLAKTLAMNPLTVPIFTMSATETRAERLIRGTGSRLDATGYGYYARLIRDAAHVRGSLAMMAQWALADLLNDLPTIDTPCLFLAGRQDRAVSPSVAQAAVARLPDAKLQILEGLGHLAHEEDPERVLQAMGAVLPKI